MAIQFDRSTAPNVASVIELRNRLPVPAERRAIRERAQLSRQVVAHDLGVTQETLYQWETGRAEPQAANLERYVGLLDQLREAFETTEEHDDE